MHKRFLLLSLLITVAGILFFTILLSSVYYDNTEQDAYGRLRTYAAFFDENAPLSEEIAEFSRKAGGVRVSVLDGQGIILADSEGGTLVGQSREEVARNAKAAQSLIDLYGDRMSAELREEVAALADKLTYLSPYDSQEVADCDKEIADLLDDCRVYLTKRTPDEASVRGALREIGEQLAEREREAGL